MFIARKQACSGHNLIVWLGLLLLLQPLGAVAEMSLQGQRQQLDLWFGLRTDDAERSLTRLTFTSDWDLLWNDSWQVDLGLRMELAGDDTGLGTTRSYATASRPVIDNEKARLEIDQASLTRRRGGQQLVIGKQVVAWGVLDGLRVTDRFAPVRLRDFVVTETRPERLSRWGVRLRQRAGRGWFDVALALDPTVNQLPAADAAFAPLAPRNRGGLPPDAELPPLQIDSRNDYIKDSTVGLRYGRRIGQLDMTALVLHGPETDPVFAAATVTLNSGENTAGIELLYPNRTLLGTTLETAIGNMIWRAELAHVPDQPVNLRAEEGLRIASKPRTLAGIGMDWRGADGLFINAQIGLDHQHHGSDTGVRPDNDWIGTLRLQQSMAQDTVSLRFEWLGSVNKGDGVLRPSVQWSMSDNLRISSGLDWFYGDNTELFGQFKQQSRVWMRLKLAF